MGYGCYLVVSMRVCCDVGCFPHGNDGFSRGRAGDTYGESIAYTFRLRDVHLYSVLFCNFCLGRVHVSCFTVSRAANRGGDVSNLW